MKKTVQKQHAESKAQFVGWWFHSLDKDGHFKWQGQIIREVDAARVEVQLYEWGFGMASDREIVALDEMRTWRFYPFIEWQREAYAMTRVSGPIVARKDCPRCSAIGDVYAAASGRADEFAVIWRKEGKFWSMDTGVSLREVRDPRCGCGHDAPEAG